MHPPIQARLHPAWVIRTWQDNLGSPISPANVFGLWEGTESPHRKETVLVFVMVCYVRVANDVLKQTQLQHSAWSHWTWTKSNQIHSNVFTDVISDSLACTPPMRCVLMCSSYLDTTRGKINIFNILISSSPGNWKYFTSCKRNEQQSYQNTTQDAKDMADLYVFQKRLQ